VHFRVAERLDLADVTVAIAIERKEVRARPGQGRHFSGVLRQCGGAQEHQDDRSGSAHVVFSNLI
jgi:hypothetical protein